MPILDLSKQNPKEKWEEFLKFAKEELNKIIEERKKEKKEDPVSEAEHVKQWAMAVTKAAVGIDIAANPRTYTNQVLYKLTQNTLGETPLSNWYQHYVSSKIDLFDHEFLILLSWVALSPYPQGRPTIDKLKYFLDQGVSAKDEAVAYYQDLRSKGVKENSVVQEKAQRELKLAEQRAREREFNQWNFNSLQSEVETLGKRLKESETQISTLEKTVKTSEATVTKLEERLKTSEDNISKLTAALEKALAALSSKTMDDKSNQNQASGPGFFRP